MSTGNTVLIKELTLATRAPLFSQYPPESRNYAQNLLNEWQDQMRHLEGFNNKTARSYLSIVTRLLGHAQKTPWELQKAHVTAFIVQCKGKGGGPASAQTVSSYCAAWRSFQSFLLDPDRSNQIAATFGVRPAIFVNNENAIPIKRYKANWNPARAQWALTPAIIDQIEAWFIDRIKQASKNRSKSLLPLLRDRLMFHLCIHFALRVSELCTLQLNQFQESQDGRLAAFGQFGTLTITGKNNVTGTIPMRELLIHKLLVTYLEKVRPLLISRAKIKENAPSTAVYDEREFLTSQLLFLSERGGMVSPQTFRDRLNQISRELCLPRKITPHTLRHTGCTLMAPLYSPEVAQRYVRHKHLSTTLYYYHHDPLNAGNHLSPIYGLVLPDDEEDEEDYE